jgi:hypothetical protein
MENRKCGIKRLETEGKKYERRKIEGKLTEN